MKSTGRDGGRTRTSVTGHGILSPERLPIPPLGQVLCRNSLRQFYPLVNRLRATGAQRLGHADRGGSGSPQASFDIPSGNRHLVQLRIVLPDDLGRGAHHDRPAVAQQKPPRAPGNPTPRGAERRPDLRRPGPGRLEAPRLSNGRNRPRLHLVTHRPAPQHHSLPARCAAVRVEGGRIRCAALSANWWLVRLLAGRPPINQAPPSLQARPALAGRHPRSDKGFQQAKYRLFVASELKRESRPRQERLTCGGRSEGHRLGTRNRFSIPRSIASMCAKDDSPKCYGRTNK